MIWNGDPIDVPEVTVRHLTDADCRPYIDPETYECTACHVIHGDPCEDCGRRGFHLDECPEMAVQS